MSKLKELADDLRKAVLFRDTRNKEWDDCKAAEEIARARVEDRHQAWRRSLTDVEKAEHTLLAYVEGYEIPPEPVNAASRPPNSMRS